MNKAATIYATTYVTWNGLHRARIYDVRQGAEQLTFAFSRVSDLKHAVEFKHPSVNWLNEPDYQKRVCELVSENRVTN